MKEKNKVDEDCKPAEMNAEDPLFNKKSKRY